MQMRRAMAKRRLKRFKEVIRQSRAKAAQPAGQIVITEGAEASCLVEGKWLKANFENEIRVDRNTHMHTGEKHAHIYDRKGNELYALTQDGKPSHNSKPFKLDDQQADALRKSGFTIPESDIVEAILIDTVKMLILG
jgi:hypothetical protein